MPNGHIRDCFDDVASGLANKVRQQLTRVPDLDTAKRKFVPFKLFQLKEAELALQYASEDGDRFVNEFHLLLAILNGRSETNEWLKRYLQEDYAKVRAAAERGRRDGPETPKTPHGVR
jgi:hypothetical protein